VAECLLSHPADRPVDQEALIKQCLALGEQLRLQHRITSGEAVSIELFKSAIKLADNRGLLGAGGDDEVKAARAAFAEELRDLVRRAQVLAELDRTRHATQPSLAPAGVG
jgi:glycerol-3-phosphate O-acyltransferase